METPRPAATVPSVAVVIPCRNEARFIGPALASILDSAYPRERLEVIIVDGMSTDGTRAILEDAARRHACVRVLDNPRMTAPYAMNLGIKAAQGEYIVRIDAHAEYPRDYIPSCVNLLQAHPHSGNAGGRAMPLTDAECPWARAVAFVTTHRFGVGGSAFRTSWTPGFVDTVPLGTFRRTVFDQVGLYDERLTRNQDHEFNARLRRAGYTIAFDPRIRINYRNQPSLRGLVRQGFFTSMWNLYTLRLHPYTWKWRRFIPMCFVSYLAFLVAAAAARTPWAEVAALPLGLYAVLVAAISLGSGGPALGRLRVATTFVFYHLSYGAGSFFGLANLLSGRWRCYLGRPLCSL